MLKWKKTFQNRFLQIYFQQYLIQTKLEIPKGKY